MKTALRLLLMILLFTLSFLDSSRAENHDVQAVRTKYLEEMHKESKLSYVNAPSVSAPYAVGGLSDEALEAALGSVNFIRYLAYLEPLELDSALTDAAQHGAVLMAANASLSHFPEQPDDMEDSFYLIGSQAAASCNLASFNWSEDDLLIQAANQFSRDDGEGNREILGHRRWLLYPGMKYTGFGLAQDAQGRSYAAMYVMDDSRAEADYDLIAWPSAGAFPAEYLTADTPWSVSFNPDIYDLQASCPRVTLTEQSCGAEFVFDEILEDVQGEKYFLIASGRYGDGPAYVFHPDLSEYNELMYGYQQNQVWTVRIEGMILLGGSPAETVEYTVSMISLTPIDPAAVEILPREIIISAGQTAELTAQVIPTWADDLSLTWESENEDIAVVDENGVVTGVKAGACGIFARSANGRYDRIEVTVTE